MNACQPDWDTRRWSCRLKCVPAIRKLACNLALTQNTKMHYDAQGMLCLDEGSCVRAEDIQRLQAEEIRVLGSSSTGFDPRQMSATVAPQHQQQQTAADAAAQQSASGRAPLFTWNLNQPQQQQQQPAGPLAIPDRGQHHGQAPPSNGFSFGTGSSNGTFVFGQSPTFTGHAGAGDMTS